MKKRIEKKQWYKIDILSLEFERNTFIDEEEWKNGTFFTIKKQKMRKKMVQEREGTEKFTILKRRMRFAMVKKIEGA